ncbi:hypothetical protein GKIL_2944 [Gloeobacter kilaueensis JS1]|uniref:IPT/TIG domain-containing protein n=2 Tax=Gloeobacter TaxID=33071 RepID=U5QND5_GLOK1|nr:hypothetical protein GKIL_2944 [Gloeobacter kilaueensis JS1]
MSPASAEKLSVARQQYGQLPVSFEPNVGQAPAAVRFLARTGGYRVALLPTGALFAFHSATPALTRGRDKQQLPPRSTKTALVQMQLVGANSQTQIEGIDALPGKVNYLKGNDRSQWHTDVATYGRVKSKGVYPGIDLIYHSEHGQLEYDFVVAPGAQIEQIKLRFAGAKRVFIDKQGALIVQSVAGQLHQKPPVVYQNKAGHRQQLKGYYVQLDSKTVGFVVEGREQGAQLVIDPVLSYSTYLGGTNDDYGYGIALDTSGNAYVTGETSSTDFPITPGVVQNQSNVITSAKDAFVTKLNETGTALVYSTYLGGGDRDSGYGIAVDKAGNAYVTGFTQSSDFPTTPGALQTNSAIGPFVTKLNATGTALVYSTYLAGSYGVGYGIALDTSGNAYVTGEASSTGFPITPGAAQTQFGGGIQDAFVTKLNTTGTALVYSTYLGGGAEETGKSIVIDNAGNAYVAGETNIETYTSPNFPTTPGALQTQYGGGYLDGFVAKLNATGTAFVYSTYLGGKDTDFASAIATDAVGNAYVIGSTSSANFPTTPGVRQPRYSGGVPYDAFVTKLNETGTALVYSTYLGADGTDYGFGIAVDEVGNAYVAGFTDSTYFPTVNGIYTGGGSGFVSRLNATGSGLLFSSYLKNSGYIYSLAIDKSGNAYVTGYAGPTFPVTPGAPQATFKGGYSDVIITKISLSTPLITSFFPTSGPVGSTITLTGTGFLKTSYVYFTNGKKAPFTIVSDTQLVVTVPIGATTAKIDVYVPFGKAQSPTAFTITP